MSTRKPSHEAENILRAIERFDEVKGEMEKQLATLRSLLKEEERARQSETKRADEAERAVVALAKAGQDANLIRENGMTLATATRCGVQSIYLVRGYVAATNAVWQRFADTLEDPLVAGVLAGAGVAVQSEATRLAAGGEGKP